MDKIYLHKVIKTAVAVPLSFNLVQVLDINPALSFGVPLLVFLLICHLPDPIGLKRVAAVKVAQFISSMLLVGAVMAGLWGGNVVSIFLAVFMFAWSTKTWSPAMLGMVPPCMFYVTIVLLAPAPYAMAVEAILIIIVGIGFGWLVDRLFWPIFSQSGIEQAVSAVFQVFAEMSDLTSRPIEQRPGDLDSLVARAEASLRGANKALKIAAMTGSLTVSEREAWGQVLAQQARLLGHLLALQMLLQENQANPLLQAIAIERSALGNSLQTTFAWLSVAIVSQPAEQERPNLTLHLQQWQSRLTRTLASGPTPSLDLASCLAVELIDHRLQGLVTDLSQSLAWLESRYSTRPDRLSITLQPARQSP